jgi:hypothetical protein
MGAEAETETGKERGGEGEKERGGEGEKERGEKVRWRGERKIVSDFLRVGQPMSHPLR